VGSYIRSREISAHADAEHEANQAMQAVLQRMQSDVQKTIDERDKKYKSDVDVLNQKFADASKSYQKSVDLLSSTLKLPAPVQLVTPPPTKENPNPVPVAEVPKMDFPTIIDYARDCEQCKLGLAKLMQDTADRQKQMELAQQQIERLKKENADLLKPVHHTFLQNLGHNTKIILYTAAGTVAAVCGSGHCK
jgi:hypothetical protein